MMGNKKLQVWLPLLFSVVLIAGMFFGYKLNKGGNSKGFFKTSRPTSLQEALDLIRSKYVDPVSLDSLQGGAIQEMMTELDPHSVYFPPVESKEAIEDLQGNFDGIGVEFNVFTDTVNVTYVLPGGPSDVAGLRIGDKIVAVNDSSLVGAGVTNSKIREFIRGKSGSSAVLTIVRDAKVQKVNVKRGSIPVPSVDAAYMINAKTGYIKLNKFTATSYEEFMQALEDLQKQGMNELIYDLRGNGGGFMNEAIDMADEFLDGDKLIVYTEGVNSKKREYRAKRPGLFEKGKLVILIDELSASASEVLAGALQDWDRATIIGRRSFGKGLVQEQYELSDGSAIRLTVARYYSPLGRSIQRPYDKGKKVYMEEISERYYNGEVLYADSNKVNHGKEYKTPSGHIVYGGGGIMPDYFVPIDTSTYPVSINRIFTSGSINSFVYSYYLKNRPVIDQYKNATDYAQHFNQSSQMWNEFVQHAASKDSVNLSTLNAKQQQTLQRRLEAFLGRFRWRNNGYYQVLNHDDAVIAKAMEMVK
ncbi:S41 family peptidase [Terrimonas sp. NA20]|uniref:S41 family peptidase n=1 Tax=Terrimonas ginsenosidimutans TaxID=2908004 RepID=A0ABS9KMT6_9BACT|nr:S41 family peptidase [Terrimonas ginsenosidimutans]MCG2613624.1 S41 family peptidase [Terrimonas ginsenosidimutans]